jgi:hypothetical protein
MDDNEDRGRKLRVKLLGQKRKGFDATRPRSYGKNVSVRGAFSRSPIGLTENDPRYRTVPKSKMPPNLTEDLLTGPELSSDVELLGGRHA